MARLIGPSTTNSRVSYPDFPQLLSAHTLLSLLAYNYTVATIRPVARAAADRSVKKGQPQLNYQGKQGNSLIGPSRSINYPRMQEKEKGIRKNVPLHTSPVYRRCIGFSYLRRGRGGGWLGDRNERRKLARNVDCIESSVGRDLYLRLLRYFDTIIDKHRERKRVGNRMEMNETAFGKFAELWSLSV